MKPLFKIHSKDCRKKDADEKSNKKFSFYLLQEI
jgi:hypothetical protein